MPLNNSLNDIKNPVPNRRGETPNTEFWQHLAAIEVELLHATPMTDLFEYIPMWGTATWTDRPHNEFNFDDRWDIVNDAFFGKILPTSLETINLVFLFRNMDLVDVTHLLRHRAFSFSAVCTADRDMRHDTFLLKPSILEHEEFCKRAEQLCIDAAKLYADMVDSNEISLLDARTILPRNSESHYFVRGNLKDVMGYIRQRIDRQIQPESDNIFALKLWIEVCKEYPMIKDAIDIGAPDQFYLQTLGTERNSHIYFPEKPRNDIKDYKEQWFIYNKERKEMLGGHVFCSLWNKLVKELEEI